MEKLIIVGAGGLGRMTMESAIKKYDCYFVDDNIKKGTVICDTQVIGKISDLKDLVNIVANRHQLNTLKEVESFTLKYNYKNRHSFVYRRTLCVKYPISHYKISGLSFLASLICFPFLPEYATSGAECEVLTICSLNFAKFRRITISSATNYAPCI